MRRCRRFLLQYKLVFNSILGDGDPSSSTDPQAKDLPNFGGPETIAFMLWPDVPTDYVPNEWWNFYPTVIVGVDSLHDISRFGAYNFNLDCTGMDATECNYTIYNRVQNPGPYFASNYTKTNPSVRQPVLYTTPSVSAPDMEFTVLDFSKYYRVPFVPGVEPVYFSFGAYMGSSVDSVGEEKQLPSVYSIPCAVRDECGVCGGSSKLFLFEQMLISIQTKIKMLVVFATETTPLV